MGDRIAPKMFAKSFRAPVREWQVATTGMRMVAKVPRSETVVDVSAVQYATLEHCGQGDGG